MQLVANDNPQTYHPVLAKILATKVLDLLDEVAEYVEDPDTPVTHDSSLEEVMTALQDDTSAASYLLSKLGALM